MSIRKTLPLLLLLSALTPDTRAGDVDYLYSLNNRGSLYLGGTIMNTLTGSYAPNSIKSAKGIERWIDLAVLGSDRYALRLDGRVEVNATLLRKLPFESADYLWQRMNVEAPGVVHAVRSDGVLSVNGGVPIEYDEEGFVFLDLDTIGPRVYTVRSDGAVYVDDQPEAIADFDGKKNDLKKKEGKGSFGDTHWFRLVLDPITGLLVSLRGDGQMQELDVDTLLVTVLPSLPFPKKAENVKAGDVYVDFEMSSNGTWYALRKNGRVYREGDVEDPVIDYPGKRKNPSKGETFVDLALLGEDFWAIRWDGKVFTGLSTDVFIELQKRRFARIGLSNATPDTTALDDYSPEIAVYSVHAVEGTAETIPIVTNDLTTPESELVVVVTELPDGATYDPLTREVSWPASMPRGTSKFTVTVGDATGVASSSRYSVNVRAADTSGKNTAPRFSTIGRFQALVEVPLKLPILASDQDGDDLTITPDLDDGAFTMGATFDAATNTFCWTAAFSSVGKTTAAFHVTDGTATKRMSFKLDVATPLFFDDPRGP